MANRKPQSDSSLELLLDTISNAFGGILFIAILVSILIRLTSSSSQDDQVSEPAHDALVVLETDLQDALARLEVLTQANDERVRTAGKLEEKGVRQLLTDAQKLRKEERSLQKEVAQQVKEIGTSQRRMEETEREIAKLSASLAQIRDQAEKKKGTLEEELAKRGKASQLPSPRLALTQEFVIVVRYGCVYQPYKYDDASRARRLNLDEFVVVKDAQDHLTISPRIGRGLPISDDEAFARRLAEIMEARSPRNWHIALAVWDDSFGEFLNLKAAVVKLGYKYRIIPAENGSQIGQTATEAQVQ